MKYLTKLILFWVCYTYALNAQDLIERTRLDLPPVQTSSSKKVAQLIEKQRAKADFSSIKLFEFNEDKILNENLHNHVRSAVSLHLEAETLEHLYRENPPNFTLNIPVNASKFIELEVTQVSVTTDDYYLQTSEGQQLSFENSSGIFYRGIIKDNPNSSVTLSIFNDHIRALITDEKGNYVLGKMPQSSQLYVLYNDKELVSPPTVSCYSSQKELLPESNLPTILDKNIVVDSTSHCVEVYIEMDFKLFCDVGFDLENANNYVTSLFNEVATIYANEGIQVVLSSSFVWVGTDPYVNFSSASEVLAKFAEFTQNDYDGRLAHFISSRTLGGGIAYRDVLCYDYYTYTSNSTGTVKHAGPYAVSMSMTGTTTPLPTYSQDVFLFSHEMGHNFGSAHTHECVWGPDNDQALDNCYCPPSNNCQPGPEPPASGGTIMSYCHLGPYDSTDPSCPVRPGGSNPGINLNAGFGQEPGDLLRNRYQNAICLPSCDVKQQYAYKCQILNPFSAGGPGNLTVINITENYETLPNDVADVEICVTVVGDVAGEDEVFEIFDENYEMIGYTYNTPLDCSEELTPFCFYISPLTFNNWVADGAITILLNPISGEINPNLCHINQACVRINLTPPYSPYCPSSLYVAGMVGEGMYQADEEILSNGMVTDEVNATYQAGNLVELQSNFEVEAGGELTVNMVACDTTDSEVSMSSIENDVLAKNININIKTLIKVNSKKLYIEYFIPKFTVVQMQLKNMDGTFTKSLIQHQKTAKGMHILEMDIDDLELGTYWIHLNSDAGSMMKKCVIE